MGANGQPGRNAPDRRAGRRDRPARGDGILEELATSAHQPATKHISKCRPWATAADTPLPDVDVDRTILWETQARPQDGAFYAQVAEAPSRMKIFSTPAASARPSLGLMFFR